MYPPQHVFLAIRKYPFFLTNPNATKAPACLKLVKTQVFFIVSLYKIKGTLKAPCHYLFKRLFFRHGIKPGAPGIL